MSDDLHKLQQRVEDLEQELARVRSHMGRGIRRRSQATIFGWPLYDIATGPDPAAGEWRGHARGVIAVGDVATGVLALGGVARGLIAFGGLAVGGICFGGCSLALLLGIGGFAAGAVAIGGMAIGLIAGGGFAVGYYAFGGDAIGQYLFSARRQDPEAVEFFRQWVPWIEQWTRQGLER